MSKEETANPAPLGLAGFGLTTVLLNIINAGLVPVESIGIILPMGLFYGGL
ncbi:MAG: acetate uptake transporter, partial [Promethearchaeota archaeon]